MTPEDNLAPHVDEITRALSGRTSADEVRKELERFLEHGVPLHQAKRDLLTMLGGARGGSVRRQVGSVSVNDQAVDLVVKVITRNEKEITARGEERTIHYGLLGDETGVLPYTDWNDHDITAGQVYEIDNAYITVWQNGPQINLGDRCEVTASDEEITPPPAPRRGPTERTIKELAPGDNNVSVKGRILHIEAKQIEVQGEPRTIWEGELADQTGRVMFTAWHDYDLKAEQAVEIEDAYVKSFRGMPSLNFGETSNVKVLEGSDLPPASALVVDKPFTIAELERASGALGVELNAVVLEIRDGSGLIGRCPECRRVLQRGECRAHGQVEGEPDLRVKAIVDDGTGAVTAFLNRATTEDLLGRTLQECQKMAQDAMDPGVVQDELARAMVGRRIVLHGNATYDEYGVTFLARSAEPAPEIDVATQAQELVDRLQEVLA